MTNDDGDHAASFADDATLLALLNAAFDDLPPVPWRLSAAARLLRPATVVAEVRPLLVTLDRRLAPAAAHGSRVLEGQFRSHDGDIVTDVREDAEAHLIVTLSSTDESVLYVRLSWSLVGADVVGTRSSLVVPLAFSRNGLSAQYDLGSIESADAVHISPAERLDIEEVTADDVDQAFAVVQRGSARRAWHRAQLIHAATRSDLADVIQRHLVR